MNTRKEPEKRDTKQVEIPMPEPKSSPTEIHIYYKSRDRKGETKEPKIFSVSKCIALSFAKIFSLDLRSNALALINIHTHEERRCV